MPKQNPRIPLPRRRARAWTSRARSSALARRCAGRPRSRRRTSRPPERDRPRRRARSPSTRACRLPPTARCSGKRSRAPRRIHLRPPGIGLGPLQGLPPRARRLPTYPANPRPPPRFRGIAPAPARRHRTGQARHWPGSTRAASASRSSHSLRQSPPRPLRAPTKLAAPRRGHAEGSRAWSCSSTLPGGCPRFATRRSRSRAAPPLPPTALRRAAGSRERIAGPSRARAAALRSDRRDEQCCCS